jgi:phosphopantothenoylcysteine decarboxylase/phosphopantothenate--cysteine ligase
LISGKTVALGVSGGIACYKVADLASRLVKLGTTVKTIMTKNATEFISPLTFKTITSQKVLIDLFSENESIDETIGHVSISEEADLFIVAPATANIIAKIAHGIADDALSTALLAARSSIIVAPAMNNHMWLNPATQENIKTLKKRGVIIVEPEKGRLACGEENAVGRLANNETIISSIENVLMKSSDLKGRTIMVTAGGTREPIDPVRFIGNRSSGKMGYAIAEAALRRGAEVILITGPSCITPPTGARVVNIETARQMYDRVMDNLDSVDTVVMAAAVADVRPSAVSTEKIKKDVMPESIHLEANPDILKAVSSKKGDKTIVGFAAESENLIANATDKLDRKNIDMIVVNDISAQGAGFDSDLNLAVLIDKNGPLGKLEMYRKTDLAHLILDWIATNR